MTQNYLQLKKCGALVYMEAARFSSDVLEMFYGPVPKEENRRQRASLRPNRDIDFYLARNDFIQWLRVWRMSVPEASPYKGDISQFAQKQKQGLPKCLKTK